MKYDFAFVGAGVSSTVMLMQLKKRGALESKRVLLIDPHVFSQRNKSLCFWCKPDDSIQQDFKELIEESWCTVRKTNSDVEKLQSFVYCQTSAASMVRELEKMIKFDQFNVYKEAIDVFKTDENGLYLELKGEKIRADYWFDSRQPEYQTNDEVNPLIYQSFYGYTVKLNQPHALHLELMDFEVDQHEYTQFMYILPAAENKVLIEFTRFGDCELSDEYACQELEKYISSRFGEFEILSREKGSIPMTQRSLSNANQSGVINLGARGGLIKSTTGYVLKNMHEHASFISERIVLHASPEQIKKEWHDLKKPNRFHFYDGLLLSILKSKAKWGKSIFQNLTQSGSWDETFHFLDEKSTLSQEAKIFSKLPIYPFLWAIGQRLKRSKLKDLTILFFLSVFFLLVQPGSGIGFIVSMAVLGIGMIAIGIPHGALDHLLVPLFNQGKSRTQILVRYVIHMFAMLVLWYISPSLALLIFLLFSAWHFGESDGETWGLIRLESFLWGIFFFYFLLGTHEEDAFQIINIMINQTVQWTASLFSLIPVVFYFIFRKKWYAVLLCLWLLIATQLPLIHAFGLYFIFHHSQPSWKRIQFALSKTSQQMWMKALPFQIGAWLFFFFCSWFLRLKSEQDLDGIYALIFISIACISWPHAWVMTKFYIARKKVSSI